MNKKILIIILLLISINSFSQTNNTIKIDTAAYMNTAFEPGEYLKYNVKYGLIPGGTAEMRIDLEEIGYGWYYSVKALARTSGLVRKMASISDKYESSIDIITGLPIRATRDIRENKYRKFNEVIFNRNNNTVTSLNTGKHNVPVNTLDILSAFYYARKYIFKNKMKKGDIINLTTYLDEKVFVMKIKFKKKQTIKTEFGKIQCLKFVPVLGKDTPFKKEKDLQIWFSDDGNFIPVKIKLSLPVGSVKCNLIAYKGLKNAFGIPYAHE